MRASATRAGMPALAVSVLAVLVSVVWLAEATGNAASANVTMKLLTYNVLGDAVEVERRIPALMKLLEESDADVIALQEVAPWFLQRLAREPWLARYHQVKLEGRPVAPFGLHVLSKFPIEKMLYRPLPGEQGRGVLVVRLRGRDRVLTVATTHLESPLEAGPTRARQLDAIRPLLEKADEAVLMGDFNFGDGEEPDTAHLDERFADAWRALHPDRPGFTWNIEKSEMARLGSFPGEKSRRIDRILVRSDRWRPRGIRIIGDTPIAPGGKDLFPSDHFGLLCALEVRGKP